MPADRKAGGATRLTRAEVVARYTPAGLNLLINKHGQWLAITRPAPKPATAIPAGRKATEGTAGTKG